MNNLPEKIYATPNFDRRWQTKAIDDESVEYIRKDAFIEKACEWLKSNLYDYAGLDDKLNVVPFDSSIFEDFKKAMEE